VLGRRDYCSPRNYQAPARDTLYRNNGDGTFTDVSAAAGLATAFGNGLGLVCGDFNHDYLPDIAVANDSMPNQLWINAGGLTFRDEASTRNCAMDQDGKAKAGMGIAAEDLDNDSDLDLMIVNLANESDSLYLNNGEYFLDVTISAGLGGASRTFTRFGLGILDFNCDGLLDIFQASGRVEEQTYLHADDPYAEPNLLFRGTPDGRFVEVSPRGGTAEMLIATSRAAAFGDIDNDGGIDVLVVNRDGPAHLLHNVCLDRGNWIMIRAIESHGRDAIGAVVTAIVDGRSITRIVRSAYSYCAANDPRVHFGLGDADHVDDVTIHWPEGGVESFGSQAASQHITLRRGDGTAISQPAEGR